MSAREFTEEELEAGVRPTALASKDYLVGTAVARDVGRKWGLAVKTLLGRERTVRARAGRLALYDALKTRGWSYVKIGIFTGRSWYTVRDALKVRRRTWVPKKTRQARARLRAAAVLA